MPPSSVNVAARLVVPPPSNQPARDLARGSDDAARILREMSRVRSCERVLPHVIGGNRIESGIPFAVVAPHDTARVLGHATFATAAETDAAVSAALAARHAWSRTAWWERAAILLHAAELAGGLFRDELLATTMLGQSKTFHQAEIDINELQDFFRYNAALAGEIYDKQPFSTPGVWNSMDHRPLEGFVLALTPFNFTAIAGNLPTTPALMGNVVVWKPSEKSALSSDVVMRVLEAAGMPPGVINLVHGAGRDVAARAMESEYLAGVTFTGSTPVFRGLWKQAADRIDSYRSFPRLVGETGGKNAVIVHPSADMRAALVALVRGAFEYQGQKCSAASRAYISRSAWERLEDELTETVRTLVVGDVADHSTFLGAVIDEQAALRLKAAIDRARGLESHSLLAGGGVDLDAGWFIEPTLFRTTDPQSFTMTDELFGPILTVYVFEDDDWLQALWLVDQTSDYALTCSIFATDRAAISEALDVLRDASGMTYVNDKPTGASIGEVWFGGGRASGTNDKTGSSLALQRWVSGRYVKENFAPATDWTYPSLNVPVRSLADDDLSLGDSSATI